MCSRFSQHYTWRQVQDILGLTGSALNLRPRYNIAPTDEVDVALPADGGRQLVRMRWGLIPSWWKKPLKDLPATFNARVESVTERPAFRSAFRSRRCIVPLSGFYEWRTARDGKQPHYITGADGDPLAAAGLWETWADPATGEVVRSCTVLVGPSNAFMAALHDRMPCLLAPEDVDPWLSGSAGTDLLKPAPESALTAWPVSRRVNRIGNEEDASLIAPEQPTSTQLELIGLG